MGRHSTHPSSLRPPAHESSSISTAKLVVVKKDGGEQELEESPEVGFLVLPKLGQILDVQDSSNVSDQFETMTLTL